MRPLLAITLTVLSACSADLDRDDADGSPSSDTAADFDNEATPDDGELGVEADLMALSGTLVFVDGQLDTISSTLDITLHAGDQPLCAVRALIDTATPTVLDDDGIPSSAFFSLALSRGIDDAAIDCGAPVPPSLGLGAVPYDAQLAPAADASGFEADAASAQYGAIVQYDEDGPVYLFGLLGSTSAVDGEVATDPSAGLADGTYLLTTLYLLPLPGNG